MQHQRVEHKIVKKLKQCNIDSEVTNSATSISATLSRAT